MATLLWPRLTRLGLRLLAGHAVDLDQAAAATWTLAPAEEGPIAAALHLPNQQRRIVALSPWRTDEAERNLVEGGTARHAASRAFLLKNVTLAGSHLYCGPAKIRCGPRDEEWFRRSPWVRRSTAHLTGTFASTGYFANFVLDELALDLALPADAPRVTAVPNRFEHAAGYRQMLGIARPDALPMARFAELTCYQDFAQHSHKAARYRELRNRIRRAVGRRQPPTGIFLDRGESGEPRRIGNREEVLECFLSAGFRILRPSEMSAEDIVSAMIDAPIVAGVEGSHLAHGVYTIADGGTFLVIQPPDRFAMTYKEFTDCMGMRFAFVVGEGAGDGFHVPTDDILATLDLIDRQPGVPRR
jgi:hypothetical protein